MSVGQISETENGADSGQEIPAVAYVRMSTDHQKYSTENQLDVIRSYATARGLSILRIFEDSGRSGLSLDGREALQSLMAEVQSGQADFKAILVYDISRWGRFQDADEGAYHEHVCSRAGIRVHYCGEQFENDGSIGSNLLKTVKRVMAGEYSRELSVKVFAGQCRLVELGYRQGGAAGYGLRRVLIDEHGNKKGELSRGEPKSLQTDHVVLAPGPAEEIEIVRDIYRQFIEGRKPESRIAADLNARGIKTDLGRDWTRGVVHQILAGEKPLRFSTIMLRNMWFLNCRGRRLGVFWRRKAKTEQREIQQYDELVIEKPRSVSQQLDEATDKLSDSLRAYSDAAYLASQSKPDTELTAAYEKVAAARKLALEGRLAYALGRCIPEHIKHWPAWIQREDFQTWVWFQASNIVAAKTIEEDGSRKIEVSTIKFVFNDRRYQLILRDRGMSYVPDTAERFGDVELFVDEQRVAKFELIKDLMKDYSRWEFSDVRALKVGPWMKDVIDIATQIDAFNQRCSESFVDQRVVEAAREIDLD